MNDTTPTVRSMIESTPTYRGWIGTLKIPAHEYTITGDGPLAGRFSIPEQRVGLYLPEGMLGMQARGEICMYTASGEHESMYLTGYSIYLADLAPFVSDGSARLTEHGLEHVAHAVALRGQVAYEARRALSRADLLHRPD
jgi:hypothetical protein